MQDRTGVGSGEDKACWMKSSPASSSSGVKESIWACSVISFLKYGSQFRMTSGVPRRLNRFRRLFARVNLLAIVASYSPVEEVNIGLSKRW